MLQCKNRNQIVKVVNRKKLSFNIQDPEHKNLKIKSKSLPHTRKCISTQVATSCPAYKNKHLTNDRRIKVCKNNEHGLSFVD